MIGGEFMFTEYIFNNKKYEYVVRDLKATLFDIVVSEEAKIDEVKKRVDTENSAERKSELQNLCEQESLCLKRVVEMASELTETLKVLDSYSRDLETLNDQMISDLISNTSMNPVQAEPTIPVNSEDPIVEVNEMVPEENVVSSSQNEMMESQNNLPNGLVEVSDFGKEQEASPEKEVDEKVEVQEVEAPVSSVEAENVDSSGQNNGVEESVENASEENVQEGVGEENTKVVEQPVTIEETDTPEVTDASEEVKVEEAVPNEEGFVLPSIDEGSTSPIEEAKVEEAAVPSEEGFVLPSIDEESTSPVVESVPEAVIDEGGISPVVEAPIEEAKVEEAAVPSEEGFVLPSIDEGDTISSEKTSGEAVNDIFIRVNNDPVRAIIVNKKQKTKLQESREKQYALFSSMSNSFTPLIPEVVESPSVEITTEENTPVTEDSLIQNGLLEPTVQDKQNQIVTLTNEAQNLYKEGKVEEAQAMLEKVSVLNKELQEANKQMSLVA